MKGADTIQVAVKSASRVSKRSGKWANLAEIKAKAHNFKEPVSPVLGYLARNRKIEKKPSMALWRPRSGGAYEHGGKVSRGTEGGRQGGRDGGKTGGGRRGCSSDGTRSSVARGIAGGAVSGSMQGTLRNALF